MASSSSFVPKCAYHVFLSFRGADTRTTFTDHLYTALSGAGFSTFRDDDGIHRCENVKSELDKAIKESRISIIVFSKGYASSRWCLDELVMILKRKKIAGHVILPVFLDVDPTQVRKQTGSFAESFVKHEEQVKAEENERKREYLRKKVGEWREALREVADLAGMVLQNQADRHESKFIQKIVKVIGDKLNRHVLHVAPHLTGIGSRAKNIHSWLQDESADVGILVIYGMGGIGKTTIAKFVYNMNVERFEASSFLANIRETSEEPKGLVRLQRQLLADVLRRKVEKISNVHEGIVKIKEAIGCKRVLVVLDDVDQRDQFDAIVGMRDWFHQGSKIILTTRHKQLMKPTEVYKMHEVDRFDDDESLELFSWHAFGQSYPIESYFNHSKWVAQHCGGLPLALQVLGSSLSGKTLDVWENALQKLAAIPDSQILKKLKISFDSLQDDHDKNLFLHIACFFIGKGKDFTVRILNECDFYPTIGIQNLIDRCLLTITEKNKLMMHQLLRDMGREIVRQESPKDPGKRSRLWHYKDSFNVLEEKTGTETIEGLFLHMHLFEEDKGSKTSLSVIGGKRPQIEELSDKLLLPDQGKSLKQQHFGFFSRNPINTARNSNQAELKTDTFTRMHKLRLLLLYYIELKGKYNDFPKRLRWLCWHGFPLKCTPDEFPLESLVALDFRNSSLEQVWKGIKFLKLLKILNLSHSPDLTNTPNFTGLSNLEDLVLKDCINLVEVHESIGELRRLVLLNLKGCKNLKKLPSKIGHLISLEKLVISGCSKLDELPAELEKMNSLTMLHADETGISRIRTSAGEDKSWSSLFWSWVLKPSKTAEPVYFSLASLPRSLVTLSLSNCNLSSEDLAKSFGSFSVLRDLNLGNNPISSLPESIKGLSVLQSLKLNHCKRLRSLPELPISLKELAIDACGSLETITNLPNLLTSLNLTVQDCDKLVEVGGLFNLEPIRSADEEILHSLGLVEFESLGSIEVKLWNHMSKTTTKGPIQGLYECGIYSIFLPRSEVPISCSIKRKGPSISFRVPSLHNLKIQALKIYVVYAFDPRISTGGILYIKITNKSKAVCWTYSPTFEGVADDKGLLWFSHWKIGNQLMEGGDKVNVSANLDNSFVQVKEVGVHVVYDEHDGKDSQHPHAYHSHHNVGDLSAYQLTNGLYFLCHHEYWAQQDYRGKGKGRTIDLDKILWRDLEENTGFSDEE